MKRLVLFTEDQELIGVVSSNLTTFQSYFYDVEMRNIDIHPDDVILLDYDYDKIDMRRFLNELIAICPPQVKLIVLSYNCERREVVDLAKRGVDRFIVKPLGRKRFKNLLGPYLGLAQNQDIAAPVDVHDLSRYAQDVL
jgi:DNA-binding response OmpR family regulator